MVLSHPPFALLTRLWSALNDPCCHPILTLFSAGPAKVLPWRTGFHISNQFLALSLLITLMMEAASTSEMSVNSYQITRRSIPQDSHLHFFWVKRGLNVLQSDKHVYSSRNCNTIRQAFRSQTLKNNKHTLIYKTRTSYKANTLVYALANNKTQYCYPSNPLLHPLI
jgi:hypothetical protein